jgi:hypothetical protein
MHSIFYSESEKNKRMKEKKKETGKAFAAEIQWEICIRK